MTRYLDLSIKEIHEKLKNKEIKPIDLVEECFSRIEENKEYGIELLQKAAEQGNEDAIEKLKNINHYLALNEYEKEKRGEKNGKKS